MILSAALLGSGPSASEPPRPAIAGAAAGATAAENSRPGDPGWQLSKPALAREIEGYASRASVAPGESLSFYVSTPSRRFDTRVYRLGWYGGAGARLMARARGTPGVLRATPRPRALDGLVECRWPASLRFRIGTDWPSGVYLARLTASESGRESFIPFVVRDARAPRAARARYLLLVNTNTWQAYNAWGGTSLYDFNSAGGARAIRVSYDRPYASGPGAWIGLGAGELLTTPHTAWKAGWEYPMIRWLERQGLDVGYAADVDLHADPALLQGRRGVLIVGHPEYWSRLMRDRLEQARELGTGIALFGANAGYWQVRYEPSASGASDRVLFCSKDHTRDPLFSTSADRDLTVRFRNLHPRRPEVALLGVMTARGESAVDADFVPAPEEKKSWVYRGTGVARGAVAALPGLVGYEADRSMRGDTLYGAWSPRGLRVVARSPIRFHDGSADRSEAATYRAASGAVVFAAGTVQWSWGLDDWRTPGLRPARRHPDAERITLNVIRALGAGAAPAPSSRSPR